jgi:cyclophilin family peptidyl-prolyl cis-trans isomerase
MTKSTLPALRARMETTAGSMTFEFFADKAPGHVENFVKLAE